MRTCVEVDWSAISLQTAGFLSNLPLLYRHSTQQKAVSEFIDSFKKFLEALAVNECGTVSPDEKEDEQRDVTANVRVMVTENEQRVNTARSDVGDEQRDDTANDRENMVVEDEQPVNDGKDRGKDDGHRGESVNVQEKVVEEKQIGVANARSKDSKDKERVDTGSVRRKDVDGKVRVEMVLDKDEQIVDTLNVRGKDSEDDSSLEPFQNSGQIKGGEENDTDLNESDETLEINRLTNLDNIKKPRFTWKSIGYPSIKNVGKGTKRKDVKNRKKSSSRKVEKKLFDSRPKYFDKSASMKDDTSDAVKDDTSDVNEVHNHSGLKKHPCKKCHNCRQEDCRKCIFCKDKPKHGGPNKLKQKCKFKQKCSQPLISCPICRGTKAGSQTVDLKQKATRLTASRSTRKFASKRPILLESVSQAKHSPKSSVGDSTGETLKFTCDICKKICKSLKGLKQHCTRIHGTDKHSEKVNRRKKFRKTVSKEVLQQPKEVLQQPGPIRSQDKTEAENNPPRKRPISLEHSRRSLVKRRKTFDNRSKILESSSVPTENQMRPSILQPVGLPPVSATQEQQNGESDFVKDSLTDIADEEVTVNKDKAEDKSEKDEWRLEVTSTNKRANNNNMGKNKVRNNEETNYPTENNNVILKKTKCLDHGLKEKLLKTDLIYSLQKPSNPNGTITNSSFKASMGYHKDESVSKEYSYSPLSNPDTSLAKVTHDCYDMDQLDFEADEESSSEEQVNGHKPRDDGQIENWNNSNLKLDDNASLSSQLTTFEWRMPHSLFSDVECEDFLNKRQAPDMDMSFDSGLQMMNYFQ